MSDAFSLPPTSLPRRRLLQGAGCAAAAALVNPLHAAEPAQPTAPTAAAIPPEDYRATGGHIKHSVMAWCYNDVPTDTLIAACAKMGLAAMEGIDPKHYPAIRKAGMQISLVGSHGFQKGPLDPDNREMCLKSLRTAIDLAVEHKSPSVITFTGMRRKGISDEQASANCVECWKQVIGYAEEQKITLCLEHLNTRDDSHPMKGHPGYFGDDVERCIDLIKRVGSPRMKLLFDIYHVQVMHGDVIRRIRQYKDYIGHVHTAGVPGRGEIDDCQEVNYPAVMRALVDVGYQGFVAHEFIPTWPDRLGALRHGVKVCDL